MRRHRIQRGAAALAVAMILLFGMTLVAFFANRTMIFEQRTSANQYRYVKAFEMADAGIEWAIARLNDPLTLTANSCVPAAGSGLVSFRDRYVRPTAASGSYTSGWLNPLDTTAFPGCEMDPTTGALACGCPAAGSAALANTTSPRFRLQFRPVAGDQLAVEIISRGCTNGDPCDPNQAVSSATDGTAIARVLVKVRPTLPTGPSAGLITGSTTVISGSMNVVNSDPAGNGITINTGSTVDLSGGGPNLTIESSPGTTPAASILDNDPSLLQLTNADSTGERFFASFFGEGFTDFQSNLETKVITAGPSGSAANGTCSGGNDCGAAVKYWADRGFTKFWVVPPTSPASDNKVSFSNSFIPNNGSLGSPDKPIAVATPGQIDVSGNVTLYGIFYAATATATDDLSIPGGGAAKIIGALISRGDFSKTGNGNLSVIYNSNLFGGKGPPSGILVPVPGSWRDKATPY
ncbi:MAG TPA: pilus assembly PilX N-terminal domain-containing protein [Burkholderiaceae bacterium]|nr:pilus assembly PilX N-terminal domain-containing protein [Burkholderiaceae bacterium]